MAHSLCSARATAAAARQGPCCSRHPAPALPAGGRVRQRGVACHVVGAGWLAGQAAGVGVAAAAAWLLSRQPAEEQDQMETMSSRPCPSCGGSGYQECGCTRWSDGDVGCNTCSHTGYMKCRSCGGRGTAVPIKVSIRKNDAM